MREDSPVVSSPSGFDPVAYDRREKNVFLTGITVAPNVDILDPYQIVVDQAPNGDPITVTCSVYMTQRERRASSKRPVVFYFPETGFVADNARIRAGVCSQMASAIGPVAVIVVAYRLQEKYPKPVNDAIEIMKAFMSDDLRFDQLRLDKTRVIAVGCSSGANIMLAVQQRLPELGPIAPSYWYCISVFLPDPAPSYDYRADRTLDERTVSGFLASYTDQCSRKSPGVSPCFLDEVGLQNIRNTYFIMGDKDLFKPALEQFFARLQRCGDERSLSIVWVDDANHALLWVRPQTVIELLAPHARVSLRLFEERESITYSLPQYCQVVTRDVPLLPLNQEVEVVKYDLVPLPPFYIYESNVRARVTGMRPVVFVISQLFDFGEAQVVSNEEVVMRLLSQLTCAINSNNSNKSAVVIDVRYDPRAPITEQLTYVISVMNGCIQQVDDFRLDRSAVFLVGFGIGATMLLPLQWREGGLIFTPLGYLGISPKFPDTYSDDAVSRFLTGFAVTKSFAACCQQIKRTLFLLGARDGSLPFVHGLLKASVAGEAGLSMGLGLIPFPSLNSTMWWSSAEVLSTVLAVVKMRLGFSEENRPVVVKEGRVSSAFFAVQTTPLLMSQQPSSSGSPERLRLAGDSGAGGRQDSPITPRSPSPESIDGSSQGSVETVVGMTGSRSLPSSPARNNEGLSGKSPANTPTLRRVRSVPLAVNTSRSPFSAGISTH